MSSIFNDKFSALSSRIDRLDLANRDPLQKVEDGPREQFAKILADLEPEQTKANKNAKLGVLGDERLSLTNLSSLETERAKSRLETAATHETISLKIGRGGVEIVPASPVKMATETVKEAAPKNMQIMPYLHDAKYLPQQPPLVALPETAPVEANQPVPEIPNLISVEQITRSKTISSLVDNSHLQEMIARTSQKHGVDPALSIALAKAESSLNPAAISTDGFASKGLFQLLDSTGSELAKKSLLGEENYDPLNPGINADLGVRYLRRLMDTFGSETQVGSQKTFPVNSKSELEKFSIAAFNAGEGSVTAAQHRAFNQGLDPTNFSEISRFLPKITQNHVERVMRYRSESLTG